MMSRFVTLSSLDDAPAPIVEGLSGNATMNRPQRPIPLRPDFQRASHYLYRAATAYVKAHVAKVSPATAAKSMFGSDPVIDLIVRGATSAADMTTSSWAHELAGVAIYDMIQSITSLSAAAELIDRGLKLNMNHVAEMRVPGRTLNVAQAGLWTSEEAPAPARQLSFSNAAILRPRKLSVLIVVSREMSQSSNIEEIVRQTLGESAGLALDAQMFSATAGTAAAPAGLFVGVTGQTPTAGGGINAIEGDIKNLFTALAAAGGGKTAVIVAAVPQATALKMTVGPKFDVPILSSTGIAAGTVAVVESASFVSGFSPVPEFNVSNQAIYQAEDTSPADPIMSGTPVKSLWQIDALALKMDLRAAYGLRAVGHAQYVTPVTW
jgi:hypothetical protein